LTDVKYGVFGCGHPDWAATYHAIPKSMDKLLCHAGGTRLVARGIGNAAVAELFEEFDDWEAQFMASISTARIPANEDIVIPEKKTLHVSVDTTRREQTLRLDKLVSATIISNDIISGPPQEAGEKGHNVKRHIEISLPKGVTYQTGDYLNILPTNPDQTVQRALRRFNLHPDDVLTIQGRSINLPLDTPVSAYELLNGFVELGQPATRRQIETLFQHMPESKAKETLVRFTLEDVYQKELATKRYSLLDILEDYPDISMDFGDFLLSLPALRVRQVSLIISILTTPRRIPRLTISTQSLHPLYTTQVDVQSPYLSLPHNIYRVMATS
jgi:cytochrome P450/NADPH-cytochrome P450 reductase